MATFDKIIGLLKTVDIKSLDKVFKELDVAIDKSSLSNYEIDAILEEVENVKYVLKASKGNTKVTSRAIQVLISALLSVEKASVKTNRKSLASAISKRIEKADADTDMISDFANAYENISSDLWDLIDLMKTIEKDSANREYKDTAVKAAKTGKEFAKICETLHDFSEKHRR